MMAVLWADIDRDLASSRHHYQSAMNLFDKGFDPDDEEAFYVRSMAFMHAMLAGYTSFEAGMKRLLMMLDEPLPTGSDSQAALVARLSHEHSGSRPAVLDTKTLRRAVDQLRGFRHIAAHVYDGFDVDRAALAIRDARVFLTEINPAIARFRAVIDPD